MGKEFKELYETKGEFLKKKLIKNKNKKVRTMLKWSELVKH